MKAILAGQVYQVISTATLPVFVLGPNNNAELVGRLGPLSYVVVIDIYNLVSDNNGSVLVVALLSELGICDIALNSFLQYTFVSGG